MPTDRNAYNESSASQLGWDPSWFGCTMFDDDLAAGVADFQREHGIPADGMCGPQTYRRAFTAREAEIDEHEPESPFRSNNHIVYNGHFYRIDWPRVVLWSEPNGLKAQREHYRDRTGTGPREIRQFVNHWDVCVSSHSCQRVLDKRGISVHFLLDADGTIYQTMDCQHVAYHAGSRGANNWSIGVEINNAYYPKYQSKYIKRGLGERPMCHTSVVNGHRLDPHMGFYNAQKAALKALWAAVHRATGVPLRCPMKGSRMSTDTEPEVAAGSFRGVVHHYHLTKRKIDCGGLSLDTLLQEIQDEEIEQNS